jgi:hypothetical protein
VIGGSAAVAVGRMFSLVRHRTTRVSSVAHHFELRRTRIMDRAWVAEGGQHRARRKEYCQEGSERTGNDTALHVSKDNT